MVTPEEQTLIGERMAEADISNTGAYMRKMALNGYVLHVDLSGIRELVSLQRRYANNLNQVVIHVNTYSAAFTPAGSRPCNGTMQTYGGRFLNC